MPRGRLALVVLVCAGCGPVEYVSRVTLQATHAVKGARSAQASTLAPYEYTIAAESLHKARELAGHARWQDALRIGNDAIKFGKDAEVLARAKGGHSEEPAE